MFNAVSARVDPPVLSRGRSAFGVLTFAALVVTEFFFLERYI